MFQMPREQPAKSIATTLSQMTLYVPDLGRLLQDWPRGANPNIEAARAEVEKLLEMTVEAPEKLMKLRKCDFGLLAALCYPTCPRAGSLIATQLLLWIFLWDDEIDMGEGYTCTAINHENAKDYCSRSLRHVEEVFDPGMAHSSSAGPNVMKIFDRLSEQLRMNMSNDQTRRFANTIKTFIEQAAVEQMGNSDVDHLPNFDNYMNLRLDTSAIGPGLAICEWVVVISRCIRLY
ncbi:unnamed protein product [Clonostachys byssicola]|uniref:Terpenoid synthase n=1 Tax=Clonostachys byssicola TaxID=160290 RepID=A0A9N9XTG7_9HYPO|nr:unnamed protein product [Clonostachys byssicola]